MDYEYVLGLHNQYLMDEGMHPHDVAPTKWFVQTLDEGRSAGTLGCTAELWLLLVAVWQLLQLALVECEQYEQHSTGAISNRGQAGWCQKKNK